MADTVPTTPGAPFGGGFYAGLTTINGATYALVVAPKAEGECADICWKNTRSDTPGARSLHDGFANSEAITDGDHPAAEFCRNLRIGGFDDWYLPSRTELNLLCEVFMPTSGGNPEQTQCEDFQDEGPEAFSEEWYWTSTEFTSDYAWVQYFNYGDQHLHDKGAACRVRAVRKVLI